MKPPAVEAATYEAAVIEPQIDEPGSFSGSAALFMRTAHDMGVQVTSEEERHWHTLLELAYAIDEQVDTRRGDITPFIGAMLTGKEMEGADAGLQRRVQHFMGAQTPSRRGYILDSLDRVGQLVQDQRQAHTPEELVRTRLDEADLFASLLALPTEGRPDKTQRNRFNSWMLGFSRCGYTVDSFLDVKDDYEDGSTSVKPTLHARLVIGKAAFRESVIAVRRIPAHTLGTSAVVAAKYFLVARKPTFSSKN